MSEKFFTLSPLPYACNALEPYIDEETMRLHHDKHHAVYINNLNLALEKCGHLFEKTAEQLLASLSEAPEEIRTTVRNNAGGHANHSMFWQIMTPRGGGEPSGKMAEEIKKYFRSFNEFQNRFNSAGLKRFGSGWVWLARSKDGRLDIMSTPNQDSPITEGYFPIMGNDVWEHAYYLKYKNMKVDYLKAWWNVVNWEEVNKRFDK